MMKKQAPGFYRMLIGAFEITELSDGTNSLQADDTLTRINSKEVGQLLARAALQEPIETSVALHVKPDKMPELKRETFTA